MTNCLVYVVLVAGGNEEPAFAETGEHGRAHGASSGPLHERGPGEATTFRYASAAARQDA